MFENNLVFNNKLIFREFSFTLDKPKTCLKRKRLTVLLD